MILMNIVPNLLKSIKDAPSLKNVRMRNTNRIIIVTLNVNSLRNKFESLE